MKNIFEELGLDIKDPEVVEQLRDAIFVGQILGSMRTHRTVVGLTVQEVADRMGVSVGSVERMELPGANPHFSTIRRYASAVGVVTAYRVEPIHTNTEEKENEDEQPS